MKKYLKIILFLLIIFSVVFISSNTISGIGGYMSEGTPIVPEYDELVWNLPDKEEEKSTPESDYKEKNVNQNEEYFNHAEQVNLVVQKHFDAWKDKNPEKMYEYYTGCSKEEYIKALKEDFDKAYPAELIDEYPACFSNTYHKAIKILFIKPVKKQLKDIVKENFNWITYFLTHKENQWKIEMHVGNWQPPDFTPKGIRNEYEQMKDIKKKSIQFIEYIKKIDTKKIYLSYSQPHSLSYESWLASEDMKLINLIISKTDIDNNYIAFPFFEDEQEKRKIISRIYFNDITLILVFTKDEKGNWGIEKILKNNPQLNIKGVEDYLKRQQIVYDNLMEQGNIVEILIRLHNDLIADEANKAAIFGLQYILTNKNHKNYKLLKIENFQITEMKKIKNAYMLQTQGLGDTVEIYFIVLDYIPIDNNQLRINGFKIEKIQ